MKMCRVRTISRKDCRGHTRPRSVYLSGFVQGEGSFMHLCQEARRPPTSAITSNRSSLPINISAARRAASRDGVQEVFECGRIWPKPGNGRLVLGGQFAIRTSRPHVLPFMSRYMQIVGREAEDYGLFEDAMHLFEPDCIVSQEGCDKVVEIRERDEPRRQERRVNRMRSSTESSETIRSNTSAVQR